MDIRDYPSVRELWLNTEGLFLDEGDSEEVMGNYLRRNRGLCLVACEGKRIVGTILCGHDGRRGVLRHLAVSRDCREAGIARALVSHSLSALAKKGIKKCNIFVLNTNIEGQQFWGHMGWHALEDNYRTMQTVTREKG